MMKILFNYPPALPCILFNWLYQMFLLPSQAPFESLLRLITVVFRKGLNFLSHLSRMPWKYYGEVIGTLSQQNIE